MFLIPSIKPSLSFKLRLTKTLRQRDPSFKFPNNGFTRRVKSRIKPSNVRKTSGARATKFAFRFIEARLHSHSNSVFLNDSFRLKVARSIDLNCYFSPKECASETAQSHRLWLSQIPFNRFSLSYISKSDLVRQSCARFFPTPCSIEPSTIGQSGLPVIPLSTSSRVLPSFLISINSRSSEISRYPRSLWEEFLKFNYKAQLYNNLRDLNAIIKRERLVFFSFYTFHYDPLSEGTMRKTRVLVPDEQDLIRSSVYLTGSSGQGSPTSTLANASLQPLVDQPSRSLGSSSSTVRAGLSRRANMGKGAASAARNSIKSCAERTLSFTRPLKLLKRKRRLVRQLARFAKWSKRYRFYKFKRVVMWWSRNKARQLKFRLRKLRRKVSLQSRLQHKRSRRSYLRGFLSRASRRKLLRRFSVEAPNQKFKRRQKGVFFKPHKLLKRKFSILRRSSTPTQVQFFKKSWGELTRSSSITLSPSVNLHPLSVPAQKPIFSPDWATSSSTYDLLAGDTKFFKYVVSKFGQSTDHIPSRHISSSKLFSDLKVFSLRLQNQFETYSNPGPQRLLRRSNLWSVNSVDKVIRKRLFRHVTSTVFPVDLSIWYYKTLVQFIENCSGRKSLLLMGPFIQNALTYEDRARCSLWNNRVTGFQRILGSRIFVHEALAIIVTAVRIKDPTFLSNWIRGMLKRLSFWKYRLIFRYVKFVLRYVLKPNFHLLDFRGVKLQLKGKISVAGNARTRTLFMRIGDTGHSKMSNRVAYDLSFVNTFTGILGFKLWFFY